MNQMIHTNKRRASLLMVFYVPLLLSMVALLRAGALDAPAEDKHLLGFEIAAPHLSLVKGAVSEDWKVQWLSLQDLAPGATQIRPGISSSGIPVLSTVVRSSHVLTIKTEGGDVHVNLSVERHDQADAMIAASYFDAAGPGLGHLEFGGRMRSRELRRGESDTMAARLAIRKCNTDETYVVTVRYTESGDIIAWADRDIGADGG